MAQSTTMTCNDMHLDRTATRENTDGEEFHTENQL